MTGKGVVVALVGISAVAVVLALSCKRAQVLRPSEAPNVIVHQVAPDEIEVTGGILHSGLEVYEVTQAREHSRIFLRVYLRPARPGARGDFHARVRVPQGIDEVWLGDPPNRVTVATLFGHAVCLPVWKRATSLPLWRRGAANGPT